MPNYKINEISNINDDSNHYITIIIQCPSLPVTPGRISRIGDKGLRELLILKSTARIPPSGKVIVCLLKGRRKAKKRPVK